MSLKTKGFKFDDFLLDPQEMVLLRAGEPVPITPKAFQLLLELVTNHHHLLSKDDLLKKVWNGSFVEEGNLTFTIRLLRKALNDNSKAPRFIETVTKRGYRFIGAVCRVEPDEHTAPENFSDSESVSEIFPTAERFAGQAVEYESVSRERQSRVENESVAPAAKFPLPKILKLTVLAIALIVGTLAVGSWYRQNEKPEKGAALPSAAFVSEKISNNGKVVHAVISSDGRNVFYTNETGSKTSVWLKQLESGNNVEIIPPTEDFYAGLALSSDGNFLYFARRPRGTDEPANIYRVSIFGGVPNKIVGDAQGWIDISPDDAKISFVRCLNREDENCSLWIADGKDGKNERKLYSCPRPFRIADNKFSPDGKSIAFAYGQSNNAANEFSLMEIEIESGSQRALTPEKFFDIKGLARLPGKTDLLISAARIPNKYFRIWRVAADSGKIEPLTKDSETYAELSLDKNAPSLLSIQIKENYHLWLTGAKNPSAGKILTNASHASFAPDGKIIFSSPMSGNNEIWTIDPSGNEQKQLTNSSCDDVKPIVSADNNSIFFASNRTGEIQVWRMNRDGSNQTQITKTNGGFPIFASPDGRWIYYHHGLNRTLWRAASEGGTEQVVYDKAGYSFSFSPDGSQFAFSEKQNEETLIVIASVFDGRAVKKIKIPNLTVRIPYLLWMPDGKNLACVMADNDLLNNSVWFQPLNGDAPRKIFNLDNQEFSKVSAFDVSPDGESFVIVQGSWLHDAVLLNGLK